MKSELKIAVCDDDEIICEAISGRICKIFEMCGIAASCDKYVSPKLLYKNVTDKTRRYDAHNPLVHKPARHKRQFRRFEDKQQFGYVQRQGRGYSLYRKFPL